MQIGVTFPTYEIGSDPAVIRAFAQAVTEFGYHHIAAYEHVVGTGCTRNERQDGIVHGEYAYSRRPFHEPLVLFGYLAALTPLELVTVVLILPQRQTALVAKQAAEIDLLTRGKLRLGIGTGWNIAEYEALGVAYAARGQVFDEQIDALRQLWTTPFSTVAGQYHRWNDVGLNPPPVQRPIPLWFGGSSEVALRRLARAGDGWFPLDPPDDRSRERVDHLRRYLDEAGRNPQAVGIDPRINAHSGDLEGLVRQARAWQALGATHLTLNTLDAGYPDLDHHLTAMRQFREALDE